MRKESTSYLLEGVLTYERDVNADTLEKVILLVLEIARCRYINASSEKINFPMRLDSRHMAAASITDQTGGVAVVLSESSIVRVFDNGEIVSEAIPEIRLLLRYSLHMRGHCSERTEDQLTVFSKDD